MVVIIPFLTLGLAAKACREDQGVVVRGDSLLTRPIPRGLSGSSVEVLLRDDQRLVLCRGGACQDVDEVLLRDASCETSSNQRGVLLRVLGTVWDDPGDLVFEKIEKAGASCPSVHGRPLVTAKYVLLKGKNQGAPEAELYLDTESAGQIARGER